MSNHTPDFMVFTGNANPTLAAEIATHLGIEVGAAHVGRFSDGEVTVEINQNVRARDVFVVQSTCAPTNESLMELLIMVDALKRASAERISAVIPYYGYARQDRRPRSSRVPISAKLVADLLQTAGVARVLTMDLHADQIQGFFTCVVGRLAHQELRRLDRRVTRCGWRGACPRFGQATRLRFGHHRQAPPQSQRV
jgi:ribose-phosphate pyrophosphokinase